MSTGYTVLAAPNRLDLFHQLCTRHIYTRTVSNGHTALLWSRSKQIQTADPSRSFHTDTRDCGLDPFGHLQFQQAILQRGDGL